MKEIREWLESGQDYAQGVALYETHGKSRVVLTALRYGNTEFTRQKLVKELRTLAEENLPAQQAQTVPSSPKTVPSTRLAKVAYQPPQASSSPKNRPVEPETVPTSPELREQRRAWFAERNFLHPQLELVATDEERLAMALRILEVSDLITESYLAEASPAAAVLATPGLAELEHQGEMRRLLANLRPQRTKLAKRPDRAPDLARVVADINLLEEKLKRDGGEPKL